MRLTPERTKAITIFNGGVACVCVSFGLLSLAIIIFSANVIFYTLIGSIMVFLAAYIHVLGVLLLIGYNERQKQEQMSSAIDRLEDQIREAE